MAFENYISYKLRTDTADIQIQQFSYLAIKNQGTGADIVTLARGDVGASPNEYWELKAGEPFSFPLQGTPYDVVQITGGIEYSIMTDGLISAL